MDLGACAIRELRKQYKLTQKEAADIVSVSSRTWEGWEKSGVIPDNVYAQFLDLVDKPVPLGSAKGLRIASKLSMTECATLMGVTMSTWKGWESGRIEAPPDLASKFGSDLTARQAKAQIQASVESGPAYPKDDPFGLESLQHLRHQAPEPKSEPEPEPETEFVPICGKNITPQDLEIIQKIAAKS